MKKLNFLTLIFAGWLLTVSFSAVAAQDEPPPADAPGQNFNKPARPNLLAELDLSIEQIRQIRRIRADQRPLLREARRKVREANRNLDQAIYGDTADEAEIQNRLKNLQAAQAEVFKINAATEYAVRRILTPAQIVKFREVRRRFAEALENRADQPKNPLLKNQLQRLNNRQRRLRQNN